ncbi:aminotransferase, class i/classii [Grosmannia clavigera kw1407]|uniref:Aminotransferase, class i/classii n=1 Tax=Grosmannia clavigera (strain kw1407 / UAMH 11150) TaxID=655863 RepID=F0XA67_GROCL|nr:aminotransferase, class i/classii [Grosmannia clavigera kw1407]EFX05549.1 aminotransferase, class i/classii [Grosmannia clavigera kw1407]
MSSSRRISINRNTGVPKPSRRFSFAEPGVNEASSKVHRQFRAAHEGHLPHAGLDATRASTGVVWCTERAAEFGFLEEPELWANLGQGAPEVDDDIEGCFPRPQTLDIGVASREYGPTAGIKPLREAVAHLYNEHHRQGKESKYTWENVAIVPGGRAGLIRIAAVLNNAYVGFFIPDYTAYNEMLSLFKNFAAIPVPLSEEDGYHINPEKISEEIARGTGVILTSNPRNPTGRVVANPELAEIQDLCRDRATLISDEFYSGYNYTSDCDGTTISTAENIIDVDEDDVLIIDGLTKRFRLPGWRVAWILGPKEFIKAIGSCGSYLDGGANVPFQEAAIPMLEPGLVRQEMIALQHHFREKRDYVLRRLRSIGFVIKYVPDSTFYLWLNLEGLPGPISDGLNFFQACLAEKVIVVPGIFFDLNPARRRDLFDSPCHHFVRFSYGPRMETLKLGCDGIERVVNKYVSWTSRVAYFPLANPD